MSEKGEISKVPSVRFTRTLPGPVEKVWAFITEPHRLPSWFGNDSTIEPRQGGKVSLMGGHIRGVVTQWIALRRLAYTWNVFMPGQTVSDYPESYLTLEVAPGKLTLTHLPVLEPFVKPNAMGWHTFLDMVEDEVGGQPVQPRETYMKRNAERYGVDPSKLPGR